MDGSDKQPEAQTQQPTQVEPNLAPTAALVNEAGKPKVEMSDAQVQALLMLNGIHETTQPKKKLPIGLIITIAVLMIFLSMVGPLISHITSSKPTKQHAASSQNSGSSQSTTDEVNNDVKQCQNVETALSEC